MKNLLLLLSAFVLFSCDKNEGLTIDVVPVQQDSLMELEPIEFNDFAIAGHTESYVYTDHEPNITLPPPFPLSSYNEAYEIDLDSNGVNDFIIKAYHSGGLGATASGVTITGIDSNKIAFDYAFPKVFENDTIGYINLAKGVNYGDTINSDYEYRSALSFRTYTHVTKWYSGSATWNSLEYVPVRLFLGNNAYNYGWIELSTPAVNRVHIKSYAAKN